MPISVIAEKEGRETGETKRDGTFSASRLLMNEVERGCTRAIIVA